jgi:hypothetical protein
MAASRTATPERDARRSVQHLDRQHDSAQGAHRCRGRRADVCDSSARALASAIVATRGGVSGGEPHKCAMPKPGCASGLQAQADSASITRASRAVPCPCVLRFCGSTPKGRHAAPRVRFGLPGLGSFRARARQASAALSRQVVPERGATLVLLQRLCRARSSPSEELLLCCFSGSVAPGRPRGAAQVRAATRGALNCQTRRVAALY